MATNKLHSFSYASCAQNLATSWSKLTLVANKLSAVSFLSGQISAIPQKEAVRVNTLVTPAVSVFPRDDHQRAHLIAINLPLLPQSLLISFLLAFTTSNSKLRLRNFGTRPLAYDSCSIGWLWNCSVCLAGFTAQISYICHSRGDTSFERFRLYFFLSHIFFWGGAGGMGPDVDHSVCAFWHGESLAPNPPFQRP